MTFWWAEDNYGQLLQCYALQKYLNDNGHYAYLIRYDPRNDYNKTHLIKKTLKALNPKLLLIYIKYLIINKISKYEKVKYNRFFSTFRDKYIVQSPIIYYSYKELNENPPDADIYIVGSDQVWNFNSISINKVINLINAYFLNFGNDKIKRMSYAASWGVRNINNNLKIEVNKYLNKFDYISVREQSGVEICKSCGFVADWVPDPTLLLSPNIYRNIYYNENIQIKPKRKYLLLYLLNNKINYSINKIKMWAISKKLDIIYVTGNDKVDKEEKVYPTIPNWLYLIDNAEYIITNSYHGCIFSILFNKKFAALKLQDTFEEMNTRFDSLWELFNVSPRFLENDNFEILENDLIKIDRQKIDKIIEKFLAVLENNN